MSRPRVYYDNVIACALVRRDIPAEEMSAVDVLEQWCADRRIVRVTSKWSRLEQARTPHAEDRAKFAANADAVPLVPNDHRLLGIHNHQFGLYDSFNSPMITDIVDQPLHDLLRTIITKDDDDVMHLMYAQSNHCDYFVTYDLEHIVKKRKAIESACSGLHVVRPLELVAKLRPLID